MNRNRFLACFFLWGILVANGLLAGCMETHHQSNTSTDKNTHLASDDLIDISAEYDYYCFSYPVSCYKITSGKYRIIQSFHDGREEITVSAEFWIDE